MTTRAQLESEREALAAIRYGMGDNPATLAKRDALTASIARVEALLSLSDDMANNLAEGLAVRATMVMGADIAHGCRTVADIVRRS